MRTKTLLSFLLLTGSTAAIAGMAPAQTEPPLANNVVEDTVGNDTLSNATDVEPSSEPADTADNATEAPEPNSTFY